MSKALNKTGRSILYSCEWPLYEWPFQKVRPSSHFLPFVTLFEEVLIYSLTVMKICLSPFKQAFFTPTCSQTTLQFVRRVTTGGTALMCTTPGAPSSPS